MVGQALKVIRESRGKTQRQVADAAGMPVTQLSGWETGRHEPRGEGLLKVCQVLGVTPGEVLGYRLEADADFAWLSKQLCQEDRVTVVEVMSALIRRRAGLVAAAEAEPAADAVVRPAGDDAAFLASGINAALGRAAAAPAPTAARTAAVLEAIGRESVEVPPVDRRVETGPAMAEGSPL